MTKRAMSLEEFDKLDEKLKLNLVRKQGAYVGKRKIKGQTVVLYQLHSFYIEVHYKVYRKVVDVIHTSDQIDVLQPYLNQIHVKDLDKDKKTEKGDL